MSENNPPSTDDDLKQALAAFGADAMDLLDDGDDDFDVSEFLPAAETTADDPVVEMLAKYGDKMDEDTTLAYAGSIALACQQAVVADARTASRYMVFTLADQQFGMPLNNVIEVARSGEIAALPRTTDWLRGVTNLRGHLYSVTDLSCLLQLPAGEKSQREKMIFIRGSEHHTNTAIIVDQVLGIRELAGNDEDLPDLNSQMASIASGIATIDDCQIILIDPDQFLGSPEMSTYLN